MHTLKSSRLRKAYKIYNKICVFNLTLLRVKLQDATLCGFEPPTFQNHTHALTTRPSTIKLTTGFEYIFLLDQLKQASHFL